MTSLNEARRKTDSFSQTKSFVRPREIRSPTANLTNNMLTTLQSDDKIESEGDVLNTNRLRALNKGIRPNSSKESKLSISVITNSLSKKIKDTLFSPDFHSVHMHTQPRHNNLNDSRSIIIEESKVEESSHMHKMKPKH